MSIYSFTANSIRGAKKELSEYKGDVLLIVNTASKCGFTPQYADLQKLYEKYSDKGFKVLGFPSNQFAEQEPGSNEEVDTFCQINYGVSFPMFEKVDVRGEDKHPLFAYLTEQAPYKGIGTDNSEGKMLQSFLEKEQPELLEGDDIKWNFTKFLIDREGRVVERFETPVGPLELESAIDALI